MDNRLLWAAIVVILIIAAIIYFGNTGMQDRPSQERPTPHAIDQGNS